MTLRGDFAGVAKSDSCVIEASTDRLIYTPLWELVVHSFWARCPRTHLMSLLSKWTGGLRKATKPKRRHRLARSLCCESLESRRLMIAEAAPFSFNGTYDAAGVVGNVSGLVRWGDGTTSPVESITGGNETGNLRIRFDYSLDSNGFFSGANASRRNLLQIAGDSIVKRFADDLAAITPGGDLQWSASIFHPSQGAANALAGSIFELPPNPTVAANEIIVYAGGRDLPGINRGVGGPAATFRVEGTDCANATTQAECDAIVARIEDFKDIVDARGEPGALLTPRQDVAPHIGSVSFDTNTDFFFNSDASGIQPGQIDFISVATHELAHVFGFGIVGTPTTSWSRLTSGGVLNGPASRAAYNGSGNPPIDSNHWADSIADSLGQETLMASSIATGQRTLFSPLDFAAMDDMGWEVLSTRVTVNSGQHLFPDDGDYPVELVLRGSTSGEVVHEIQTVNVTNVAPTLTVSPNLTVQQGVPLTILDIGEISDPGFRNNSSDPRTDETFSFTVNWGDDSELTEGTATIDRVGSAVAGPTLASFNAAHTYDSLGNKTVTVSVADDDGGTAQRTFTISVTPPPVLSLTLNQNAIDEDAGSSAATLTVSRSGPATGANLTVNLSSSDTTEATIPPTAVIPGDATQVTVPVNAVDDALLDGDVTLQLNATASGLDPASVDLLVRDKESLGATFALSEVSEDRTAVFNLLVTRSNTNVDDELVVNVSGANTSQLSNVPAQVTIPGGQPNVLVPLTTLNDDDPEPTATVTINVSAANYTGASTSIDVLDDEPPFFQNPVDPFDVNNNGDPTAGDALVVINQLAIRGANPELNPQTEQPNGVFLDVNGDYRVTALDALNIINEVGRRANAGDSEQLPLVVLPAEQDREEFDSRLEVLSIDVGVLV